MKRILLGLVTVAGAVSAISMGVTGAFFSDTELSSGNTFAAGDIDLLIDNTSYYNGEPNSETTWEVPADLGEAHKFFNFLDLKPDDYGEDTISIHVDTNDAYMCAEVTLTSNDDNGINEPEGADGDVTDGQGAGELADLVNFIWWADDGDNVLEDNETVLPGGPIGALAVGESASVALADSDENIWTGEAGPIEGDETFYIGKAWCFGDIGTAPVDQDDAGDQMTPAGDNNDNQVEGEPEDGGITCDGLDLDNQSQTDSLTADISFSATQARNNPTFQCEEPDEPPTFGACTEGQEFADAAGLFDQGRTKLGALIVANRSNPAAAFGAPQTTGTDSDVGFPAGSFVSLGFAVSTTSTRSLVLDFSDNVVVDGTGADLKVYEVTGGVYPDEHIKVEISQDGTTWHVAAADVVRDEEIDISGTPLDWARYVRITDLNNPASFSDAAADGYDLDAIEALNCAVPEEGGNEEPEPEPIVTEDFGVGECLADIAGWDEDAGESCVNGTVAAAIGAGDDTASPDGGRFALIGNNGYICRSVNAVGQENLTLEYYWRGDSDGDVGDEGLAQVYTGGTCASPTGLVNLTSHDVTVTSWSTLQALSIPDSFDNTSFFVRFAADTNGGTESFRIDGVEIAGTAI